MDFFNNIISNQSINELQEMIIKKRNIIENSKQNNNSMNTNYNHNIISYINNFVNFMTKFVNHVDDKYISFETSLLMIIIIDIFIFNNYLFPIDYYFKAYKVCLMGFFGHAILEFIMFAFDEFIMHLYNKYIKEPFDAVSEKYK